MARRPNSSARWLADKEATEATRDDALRRIGAEIFDEPIPERLVQVLANLDGDASTAAHRDHGSEGRDAEEGES